MDRKGLTLIPTRIYFKGPRAKVELALARARRSATAAARSPTAMSQRDVERELSDRQR